MRSFLSRVKRIQVSRVIAATYEINDNFSDQLELESEVTDWQQGYGKSFDDPAEDSRVEIKVTHVTFSKVSELLDEKNDGDKETYDMLKILKVGDKLKLDDAWGTVQVGGRDDDDYEINFRLKELTVKGVRWDKSKDAVVIDCDEKVVEEYSHSSF